MPLWKHQADINYFNTLCQDNMVGYVGIVITEIGDDFIKGTMPVDHRTRQHMGIVHGGASVVLAETLGSIGAGLCCPEGSYTVGLDINANHIRAGKPPLLTGIARAIHVGSSTMVWEIRITDGEDKLVCIARLTCAVLKHTK